MSAICFCYPIKIGKGMPPGKKASPLVNIIVRLLLPSVDDTLEISSLQRSTTDQTTVDVWLSEELRSVASLAATTVED